MSETETKPVTPEPQATAPAPKKKRVKTRFTSREQIIAQIDKFTKKLNSKHVQAAKLLSDAKHLRRMAAEPNACHVASMLSEASAKDDRAQKLGKQVKRIEDKVLPSYKRKLAEFQTAIIPGFLPDNSVEAPKT